MDDGYEYAREYYDFDGTPKRRVVTKFEHDEHRPDGHRADGSPYWNYQTVKRRKAGAWEPAD